MSSLISISRRSLPIAVALILFSSFLMGCSQKGESSISHEFPMASLDGMPPEVLSAPKAVQTAYQFAIANPEVTRHIPCYCGCGSMGHTSNYSCYASGEAELLAYDLHATGCSICVDITLDAMRLHEEGQQVSDIRAYIDSKYARFGPSNMP